MVRCEHAQNFVGVNVSADYSAQLKPQVSKSQQKAAHFRNLVEMGNMIQGPRILNYCCTVPHYCSGASPPSSVHAAKMVASLEGLVGGAGVRWLLR